MAQLTEITSPEFVAEYEVAYREVTAEMPVAGIAVVRGGTCSVMFPPKELPLDAIAANYVAWMEGQPDSFTGGATVTDVTLPGGQPRPTAASHTGEAGQAPRALPLYR